MPARLVAMVAGWLGPRFAKWAEPLIWFGVAAFIAAAVVAAIKIHDHHVIAAHDAAQDATTANADKQADDDAGDQRTTDAVREQDESHQTQEAIDAAHRNGADPRAAFYACVRKQQAARSAGQPSPKC